MSRVRLTFFITTTIVLLSLIGNTALYTVQQQKAVAQSTVNSTGAPSNATTANNFLVYSNPNHGIKIDYPANWKLDEHPYTDKFIALLTSTLKNSSDVAPATFTASVETLKKNISLDNYTNANLAKAKQSLPHFQLIDSNATILAGIPAHKIVYTFVSPDPAIQIPFKSMNIWTIKQGKAYNISYTQTRSQYDKYLGVIEHMINSFSIIK
ncbi:MAG TPA: PsbP-related protein [Nitrososphaeraceae archaeon]